MAILNDAAVRNSEELGAMGLPIWTREIRSRGAIKDLIGEPDGLRAVVERGARR